MEKLKRYDLNCNIFDVYDYDGLSMQELLCQFYTKINECVDFSNSTLDLCEWLVNEGLKQEVALKLTTWLNDGTLENLINVTLFENLNKKIDNVESQLEYIEDYKNNVLNILEHNKCVDTNCNGNCGKVKGDGIHDDTLGIQSMIDYCWDNNIIGLYLPKPTKYYKTTKPLHLWCASSGENKKVELIGDGREFTRIVKHGKLKSDINYHTDIDSVIILINSYIKNGGSITNVHDSANICYFPVLKGLSLESESKTVRNDFGLYSLGFFYGLLYDVQVRYATTGFATQTWNCYNKFNKLRCDFTINGCDFGRTQIGGQTTMNFEDCHMNGLDGFCYSIYGIATFTNCAIDGGGGTHYKAVGYNKGQAGYQSGKITLINCHHESPGIFADNHMFELNYSHLFVYGGDNEIPYTNFTSNSSLIKATNFSTVTLSDGFMKFRTKGVSCPGKFIDMDATSTLKLNNFMIDRESFDVYTHFNYSKDDCECILNRKIKPGINKFISYIPGNVTTDKYPTSSSIYNNNRLEINTVNNYNNHTTNVFLINKKVDLTNKSRIKIEGDVTFLEGSGTGLANMGVMLYKNIVEDGSVGKGTSIPCDYSLKLYGEAPSNYSSSNFNRYVDITDIEGEYYIGISFYGLNINSSIKEVKVIR